jgi:FkbM family methyltransferase
VKENWLKRISKARWQITGGLSRNPNAYLRQISGIIHIGANTGQERELYAKHNLNVIWIEPIPEVFTQLEANLRTYPCQRALQYLVTDKDGGSYEFHISNNDGLSSSILELGQHRDIWPDVKYERHITLKGTTLASIVEREGIDLRNYDALVMDTQGSELLVLKGAARVLSGFTYIKTEAADFESYENCAKLAEIEVFLHSHGFRALHRKLFASRPGGGGYYDVIYKKSG